MRQQNILTFLMAAAARKMARLHRRLRRALVEATYRPELHYMRGPGPKWREKHDSAGAVLAD